MKPTVHCIACGTPTSDFYPSINQAVGICRDCHENGVRRSTMEEVHDRELDSPYNARGTAKISEFFGRYPYKE
jgi:recombinational DNA repair protein (RecF pathway)